MRKSYEELQHMLTSASEQIKLGSEWVHYKNPDKKYEVKEFVIIESTQVVGVVYESEDNPGIKFMRPLDEFFDNVKFEGETVKRFRHIN
ncbi:DUF1653 domain-containing protein [Candidatus Dojkabacteria bacterium]|uniref:DUF1653 domain-containing protein n=1 Tax=Candidatus Dojkabacteria bacterium TaxID=2099670 RepID=A0A955LBG6_9BACT|nr:DUF1653 domain-containing protein [Candidatus Dojkabacteria bacterium]